jgi:hypothetical protein
MMSYAHKGYAHNFDYDDELCTYIWPYNELYTIMNKNMPEQKVMSKSCVSKSWKKIMSNKLCW